jgi:hypothetical protein
MQMSKIEEIASTVLLVLKPGMKPKELLKAVEQAHPKASKKDVARGAFFAMLTIAEKSPDTAQVLYAAGMSLRVGDDDPTPAKEEKPKKGKASKDGKQKPKKEKAKKARVPEVSSSKH